MQCLKHLWRMKLPKMRVDKRKAHWNCPVCFFICAFLLHPKHLPLLGPVFGDAFAELGKGERGGFFAVEDGFDNVRGEVDQTPRPEEKGSFLFDFLRQFGNRCHLAGFQHIPVLQVCVCNRQNRLLLALFGVLGIISLINGHHFCLFQNSIFCLNSRVPCESLTIKELQKMRIEF